MKLINRTGSHGHAEAFAAKVRIGIDVGGTFTDFIVFDVKTGELQRLKISSTPKNPSKAILDGLRLILRRLSPESIEFIVHASTIGSNLFLGQLGLRMPKTALITTKGFRDVLEIGRQRRPELYNVFFMKPKPLVPRRLRLVLNERIGPDGRVIVPLQEGEVHSIVKLLRSEKVESIAICLLHSYVNPVHERKAAEIIRKSYPEAYVVASHEVDPEYREYERTSTTVVNAVLMPILTRYTLELEEGMRRLGVKPRLLMMLSSGGVVSSRRVIKVPAATIESGPAAGVIAAAYLAKLKGFIRVLSFDMGGTTAKVCAITHGRPILTSEFEVGGRTHRGRLIRGSGYVVRYPHIDLAEVSAGGGTIAWVDEAGRLRVGPYSAGADPGPACYGRGGLEPTVTDANLVLGRISTVLAGGEIVLRPELAMKAIREGICKETGLDPIEAAYGIIKLANTEMARAMRIVTVERGLDPRRFTIIAFGGAGPMHVCELAEDLKVDSIIVPLAPGTFSALGLLLADYKYDLKLCLLKPLSKLDSEEVESLFRSLEDEGREALLSEGISEDRMVFIRYADLRYHKQAYELMIEVPSPLTSIDILRHRFIEKHKEVYGYAVDEEITLVNLRISAIGVMEKPKLRSSPGIERRPAEAKDYREVYFGEIHDWLKTPVYERNALKPGHLVEGPAVIEEYDSTTVIPPDWQCVVDEYSNLLLRKSR